MGARRADYESPIHWRYLLALENNLLEISRYVEFSEDNYSSYSLEIASVLIGASSEVDVVAKQLCKKLKTGRKAENIKHYSDQISPALPAIGTFIVDMPRFGLRLTPWENWSLTHRKSPLWWTAHNSVKHNRHTHFSDANLKHALNAVSGLYVLALYLYQELATEGRLAPNTIILRPSEEHFGGTTVWDTDMLINYAL